MSRLATSKTKSEAGTLETFASLRFFGDRLEPHRITKILDTVPTVAYRKGEVFKKSKGQEIRGRTGLWLVSSEGNVNSRDLNEHLDYLLAILRAGDAERKLDDLHALMHAFGIAADVSCFWYGEHGARPPAIRDDIRARLASIPAKIESDFDTD